MDDVKAKPFQLVRYPREEGRYKADQQQARSQWFQQHLGMSRREADDLAFFEMEQLFEMEPGRLSQTDPLRSINVIADKAGNDFDAATAAYWQYFNQLDSRLLVQIPMQTFAKTSYHVGQNLDLYPNGKKPPKKSFFTTNARRFENIAQRLAAIGTYTEEEERAIHLEESREMIRPASRYGINPIGRDFADKYNVARQSKLPERCRRAYNDEMSDAMSIRMSEADMSIVTEATEKTLTSYSSTIPDWSESSQRQDNTPVIPEVQNVINERCDQILDADSSVNTTKPKLSVREEVQRRIAAKKQAKKSEPVPELEMPKLTEEVKKVSIRQNLQQKKAKLEWEFDIPDSHSMVGSEETLVNKLEDLDQFDDSFPPIIRPRPKATTVGSYFESFAAMIPPMYGSIIFPAPSNMEKLHWEVATGSMRHELERYDGEYIEQYIEDIRQYMAPIIEAMDYLPENQWVLDRYGPHVHTHLRSGSIISPR